MADKPTIEYKNINHEPGKGYYVGYLKGKRKKYVEQAERYETPEEAMKAMKALGLKRHWFLAFKDKVHYVSPSITSDTH